jgi:GNAT superfamily N-acetyltransferase
MRFQKYINEATYPLPKIDPKTEAGIMTREEYLKYRNSEDKWHEPSSYDFDLKGMNSDHQVGEVGYIRIRGDRYDILRTSRKNGYIIKKNNRIVAVYVNGTLYHNVYVTKGEIPNTYMDMRSEKVELDIKKTERVKYLSDKLKLVSDVIAKNRKDYPVLINRIKNFKGEYYELRAEKKLVKDKGIAMALFNEDGEIVGIAQDEWGATLVVVAREYRGKGLSKKLFSTWIEWNPSKTSGGMTDAGRNMSINFWEERVRKFLEYGWYDQLVRKKQITMEKINQILAGLSKKRVYKPVKKKSTKEEPLFLIEDSNFVVYDKAFYDIADLYTYDGTVEKTIYATGLLRSSPGIGTYAYSIDYEPKYRKLAHEIILQMVKDDGEKLYYGKGYTDILELKGMPIKKEGDYISLTKDVLPLKQMARVEKRYRKERDQYDELFTIILETADSKWK